MKLLLALALSATPGAAPVQPPRPADTPPPAATTNAPPIPNGLAEAPGCTPITRQFASTGAVQRGDGARRLDTLPPAQLELSVDRQVDGCREAVIIRRDVGAPAGSR